MLAAAADGARGALVVSLHDVAPATQAACEQMIEAMQRLGVANCSLLVVPNYHHTGPSFAHREFTGWLRRMEASGHEIVIHGYYHDRPARSGESLRDRLLTQVYTSSEGEFYDLPYDEAFRRISTARDEFAAAGLRPRGFIAPAWLINAEGERAVADCELEYTVGLASVTDLREARRHPARSIVYSVRNSWRRSVSKAWNAALFRRAAYAPLLRISLHPPDIRFPDIWRQAMRIVRGAAAVRTPMTYSDWVAQQRINPAN